MGDSQCDTSSSTCHINLLTYAFYDIGRADDFSSNIIN